MKMRRFTYLTGGKWPLMWLNVPFLNIGVVVVQRV